MGCADVVDALEQRLQGQHTGPEQEALDAHLPGCADCRSYLEVAARVELQLAQRALAPPPAQLEVARGKALAQVAHLRRQDRMLRNYLVAAVVGIPLFERLVGGPWAGPDALERVGGVFAAALLMGGVIAAVRWGFRRSSAALAVAQDDGELIAAYRRQLDRRIRAQRWSPLIAGGLAALYGAAIVGCVLQDDWVMGGFSMALMIEVVLLGPEMRRRVRELRAEREALQ